VALAPARTTDDWSQVTPVVSNALLRTQSDERLVALAAAGHERAFEAIVERYRSPLLRYCRRMLPEARAEDAVQQAFLNAWSALGRGADVHDLRPWLYRIAHNTAINGLKASGFDYDELEEEAQRAAGGPFDDIVRRDEMRETLANLAALPDRQREALVRTAISGDPQSAVAHDLGITDGAVRQLVHRARAQLRAVATAVTPAPVVAWAASLGPAGGEPAQRIVEAAAGAGGAGLVGVAAKAGAVVAATGVLVTPGSPVRNAIRDGAGDSAGTATKAPVKAPAEAAHSAVAPSSATPATVARRPPGAARGSSSATGSPAAGDTAYAAPADSAGDDAYGS